MDEKITIGDYRIMLTDQSLSSGGLKSKYWICHRTGEGTEVDGEKLEKLIHDFFEENM